MGPWCKNNVDLLWWEKQNLTGALIEPTNYRLGFEAAFHDVIDALTRCVPEELFFPVAGTLIALHRHGDIAGDLGDGVGDHVDKDLDFVMFARWGPAFCPFARHL